MLPLTPPKLGRYEIVDEIGKGAMGVVYLARDPLIGRLVALKTFRIGYSVKDQEMEQFRIRFMREAQSAGILSHPNIVTIHDVVEQTGEGMAFIAMEYVRGTTLKAMLQSDQAMSLSYVVDIVSQVAEALDYAHVHRVIHRDVKPANILITAENRVKITDFGIARLDTSNLTQEGQLLGTPNYMAPEQIQGKEVDHRADLFALGVVLYEMLTRHKPFQGENLTVVSHRIVYDQFTPPREYARELPPGLERILDRALEKDPARRYQHARDMVDDLRRILAESSRDDLNETLSIASWAPGTQPPPPSPPGGGATTAASPAGAAAAKLAKPAKPPRARTPLSVKRLAVIFGAAAVVLVLGLAALKLGVAWSGKPAPGNAAAEDQRVRYVGLIKQGRVRMEANDFPTALQAFSEAARIAPGEKEKQEVQLLIQTTEDRAAEYIQTLSRSEQIAAYLLEAGTALDNRRWAEAQTAADKVLEIDPANADATRIKGEAQVALVRLREQRPRTTPGAQPTPSSQAATATPQPEAGPSPEPTAAANEKARLRISLQSEMAEPTVIVRIEGKEIFRETFHRGSRFLRRETNTISESRSVEVPAGINDLQVQVSAKNKAADVSKRSGNFPVGASRTLNIQISASGAVSVNLD
jgi:serine/threonine-protein kinase